jgi:hypothetical protein
VKKTLLVAALAAMLLFAVAGSAFAVNHSGQDRIGAAAAANASSPTSATIVGGGTNTYEDWSTLGTNVGTGNSPHGNFTTTTVKCVVCHAVHYAAPGGAVVGSGQTADTLLRRRADQACMYCHATAGQAVNGTPVYDGVPPLDGAGGATNEGHVTGTNCSVCHSSVHGANADHSVAALDGYLLLKIPVAAGVTTQGVPTTDMLGAITAIDFQAQNQGFAAGAALAGTPGQYAALSNDTLREQAVGVFCAECHNGAYATGAAGASTNVRGSNTVAFSGHRIAATATSNWNVDGSKSSGTATGTIAWAPAANCKACHDANDTFGNTAFPHSWGGTKMWLTVAADAGAAKTNLPFGTAPGSAYNVNKPQLSDGVCLKCHVASGGAEGVGITF